ncbi:MAG: aminomethyltransferase beta-barrel domain-containing protein, partial [Pseudomonadota bacterium]
YVARKDLINNQLIVVQGTDHPALHQTIMTLSEIHWINPADKQLLDGKTLECRCKTRYRQNDQACFIEASEHGFKVTFESPQRAVTPGQYAVFYLDDTCLGGGVIEHAE